MVDEFKCVALNCCGFNSKMNNGIFDNFLCDFDLICLSETNTQHADISHSALQDSHVAINSDLKNVMIFNGQINMEIHHVKSTLFNI